MFKQRVPVYFLLFSLHVTIESLEWLTAGKLSQTPLPEFSLQLGSQYDDSYSLMRQFFEDRTILNLLSLLKGIPQNLSKDEIKQLRDHAPSALKKWSNLVNNEHLLKDLSHGKIKKDVFDDLTRSINFLEISPCDLQPGDGTQTCLIRKAPIPKPNDPIYSAHLVTHVLPWINPNQIQLTLYLLDKHSSQLERKTFELRTINESLSPPKLSKSREITWDITSMIELLQAKQANFQYPILMSLESTSQETSSSEDSDDSQDFPSPDKTQILAPNAQALIQIRTLGTKNLEIIYSRKRISGRSFLADSKTTNRVKYCPSFLDLDDRETKCCLFRYTLNKKQMDQNDKLRFIIFPHHLPMNMCHGRCIGLFMPTDNAHTILMNRYFSGLGASERVKIYNSMPCCAANESIAFTIVYRNDRKQLVTETLFNAVKTNCACR